MQPTTGSVVEDAWKVFLNYDGDGSAVAGAAVSATSSDTPVVGAYAFLDSGSASPTLRVLLTGKTPQGSAGASAELSISWPAGTPSGNFVAELYGLSGGSPHLAPLGNVTLACGSTAPATPIELPPWSFVLLVAQYECL